LTRSVAALRGVLIERAGRRYCAGRGLEDAADVCDDAAASGHAVTIAFWDRDVTPEAVLDATLRSLRLLAGKRIRGSVAVKAPALGFERLPILRLAAESAGSAVQLVFDSHRPEHADATLALARDMAGLRVDAGCAIPARWARSADDARRAADDGLALRVVKGQWPDLGDGAWANADSSAIRTAFLDVVEAATGARRVGVATHDVPLARTALLHLREQRTACELELLLGLPRRKALRLAADLGVPVRLYVPFGAAWLPYEPAEARGSARVAWWLLRDGLLPAGGRLRPRP
jgi:proline dehydrogenase